MKSTVLKIVAGVGLLALIPTAAMAHSDISIGLNLGGGYVPAPVYAAPAPAYYGPAPTVVYGYGDDWRRREWEEQRWRHHEWEEHRWHEDHGWHGRDDYRH
ncbi:MAG: hypothetical protein P4L83_03040 [Nevskia sp.]|nr:hypothetical protein [Nevskia sp.]